MWVSCFLSSLDRWISMTGQILEILFQFDPGHRSPYSKYVCDIPLKVESAKYRKWEKLHAGKISRIAFYFAYRWKSFTIPTMHCWNLNVLAEKFLDYEFAKLFPRVTFPVYCIFLYVQNCIEQSSFHVNFLRRPFLSIPPNITTLTYPAICY